MSYFHGLNTQAVFNCVALDVDYELTPFRIGKQEG